VRGDEEGIYTVRERRASREESLERRE